MGSRTTPMRAPRTAEHFTSACACINVQRLEHFKLQVDTGTSALLKWRVGADRYFLDLPWLADCMLKNKLTYWRYWQTTYGQFISRMFNSGQMPVCTAC
jgi:hypothetical protein